MKRLLFCLVGMTMTLAPLKTEDFSLRLLPPPEPTTQSIGQQLVEFIDRNNVGGRTPVFYHMSRQYQDVMEIISSHNSHHDTIFLNFNETQIDQMIEMGQPITKVTSIKYNNPKMKNLPVVKESYLTPLGGRSVQALQLVTENSPFVLIDNTALFGALQTIAFSLPGSVEMVEKKAIISVHKQKDQPATL